MNKLIAPCTGQWAPRHMPVMVSTRRLADGFRRRYWIRCWVCDLRLGPFLFGDVTTVLMALA